MRNHERPTLSEMFDINWSDIAACLMIFLFLVMAAMA